jgi:formylglycine-generating enzyme required for sulfatase activity
VGIFPEGASPYGVLDMAGNVWEWCGTQWQADYENYQADLEVQDQAVVRGGAFDDYEGSVRCASRNWSDPDFRYHNLGFRVVCGAPIPRDSDASDL